MGTVGGNRRGRKIALAIGAALFTLGLVCLLLQWAEWSGVPNAEKPIGALDYWLNRYQALVAGILAILGAAFAVYAAKISISYDREKVEAEGERRAQRAVEVVLKLLAYSRRAVATKLAYTNLPPPTAQLLLDVGHLDADPLEKAILGGIDQLPVDVAVRSMYVVYCMRFTKGSAPSEVPSRSKNKTDLDMPFVLHLKATLFAIDVLYLQLIGVRIIPTEKWDTQKFNEFPRQFAQEVALKLGLQKDQYERVAKEMELVLTDEIPRYLFGLKFPKEP
jgi:hypothetical protein